MSPKRSKKAKKKKKVRSVTPPPLQQDLDIFHMSDEGKPIGTILPGDIRPFLMNMRKRAKALGKVSVVFDNDIDGFCSAILIKKLMDVIKVDLEEFQLIPVTHLELANLEHKEDRCYIYVDTQPRIESEDVFCIDHHPYSGVEYGITKNFLIYSPGNTEIEYPISSTLLVSYLIHLRSRGRLEFLRYVSERVWAKDPVHNWFVIICGIADNLWMLSQYAKINILRDWLKESGLPESPLIKISMMISLLLGRPRSRLDGLKDLVESPPDDIIAHFSFKSLENTDIRTENLYSFAEQLSKFVSMFVTEINDELDAEIEGTIDRINKDNKTIEEYQGAMPLGLKKDKTALLGMVDTVGDKSDPKWKQIEFYGNEINRLSARVRSNTERLAYLQEKKGEISPDHIQGVCVFINNQASSQVKGILSSLLYYFGNRNIVIEEFEHHAVWGARGINKEQLKHELTTLQFDKRTIEVYCSWENIVKNLPLAYRRSLNITNNITFFEGYSGGIGGRGRAYGGDIKGKVPLLFATLETKDLSKKISELMSHSELGAALKGLTEGDSQAPTTLALRTKFKTGGWVTIQAKGGVSSGDVMSGDVGMVLAWLGGKSKPFNVDLKKLDGLLGIQ